MTVTITHDQPGPRLVGNRRVRTGQITFDSVYPTGGEAVSLATLGLDVLENLDITNIDAGSSTSYAAAWNKSKTAPKVLVFIGDYNNGTDGPFIEAAASADLSALVVRYEATGF
jgi:hypothetical protein